MRAAICATAVRRDSRCLAVARGRAGNRAGDRRRSGSGGDSDRRLPPVARRNAGQARGREFGRHACGRPHGPCGPDLGLRRDRACASIAPRRRWPTTPRSRAFSVERGVAGMPTAFVATYGSGRPVIGIMGEYDALPGISQKASPVKEPLASGRRGSRLRSQPVRRRESRRRDCDQGADRGGQAQGHGALLRHAGRGGRTAARSTWRATGSSTASTSCSPGIPAMRRRPT